MEETIQSPKDTLLNTLNKTNSHSTWLDAHTELITKLESEYETPEETKEKTTVVRHYGFNIGVLNLLIAEDMPCEVLEENSIYSIPLAPSWLIGTCNVRGDIIPIIDLEHILSGKDRITKPNEHKTFIIGEAENAMGLLLNKLPIPIHFKEENQISNFSGLPKQVRSFITIGYKREQQVWICIDYSSFFTTLTSQQNT